MIKNNPEWLVDFVNKYKYDVDPYRIKNIAICFSKTNDMFEIVKYYDNKYYGNKEKYVDNGDGTYSPRDDKSFYIHEGCFSHKETCYVLAFMIPDNEHDFDMRTVGRRVSDLTIDERCTFFDVLNDFYADVDEFFKEHDYDC